MCQVTSVTISSASVQANLFCQLSDGRIALCATTVTATDKLEEFYLVQAQQHGDDLENFASFGA